MASCTATACTTNFATSTLEITVISADDLRQGRQYLGRGAFVTIRSGPVVVSTSSSTEDAHGYPLWNECLRVKEPSRGGWLQVDISKRKHGDPKATPVYVAGAKVPLSDFSYGPVGYKHFLSYRLKDQNGMGNGIVNLCVRKLGGNGESQGKLRGYGESQGKLGGNGESQGKLGGNGESQFNGGTPAMGYPVAPVGVSYGYGYSAYGK